MTSVFPAALVNLRTKQFPSLSSETQWLPFLGSSLFSVGRILSFLQDQGPLLPRDETAQRKMLQNHFTKSLLDGVKIFKNVENMILPV